MSYHSYIQWSILHLLFSAFAIGRLNGYHFFFNMYIVYLENFLRSMKFHFFNLNVNNFEKFLNRLFHITLYHLSYSILKKKVFFNRIKKAGFFSLCTLVGMSFMFSITCSIRCCNSLWYLLQIWFFLCFFSFCVSSSEIFQCQFLIFSHWSFCSLNNPLYQSQAIFVASLCFLYNRSTFFSLILSIPLWFSLSLWSIVWGHYNNHSCPIFFT